MKNNKVVKEIMKKFDFDTVHRMFVENGWEWVGIVPTKEQLKLEAERLVLNMLAHPEYKSSSTGRLEVVRSKVGDGVEELELRFVPIAAHGLVEPTK